MLVLQSVSLIVKVTPWPLRTLQWIISLRYLSTFVNDDNVNNTRSSEVRPPRNCSYHKEEFIHQINHHIVIKAPSSRIDPALSVNRSEFQRKNNKNDINNNNIVETPHN